MQGARSRATCRSSPRWRSAATTGGFARLRGGGFVPRAHLAPVAGDFVAQAERFIGAPYLWGGRSARGHRLLGAGAAGAAGGRRRAAPRDSDMQAALLGAALPAEGARCAAATWCSGTAMSGSCATRETLLHANAHHMAVAAEPLAPAAARIAGSRAAGR